MGRGRGPAVSPEASEKTGVPGDVTAESRGRMLRMMQFSDSFFPSGSFTLSHGLESWLQHRSEEPDAEDLRERILNYLEREIVPSPAVIVLETHRLVGTRATDRVRALDRFYRFSLSSRERRETSLKEGRSVRELVERSFDPEEGDVSNAVRDTWAELNEEWNSDGGSLPVSLGLVGRLFSLERFEVSAVYLYSVARTITASAMRLGVLDHFGAQRILAGVNDRIPAWFDRIDDRDWAEAGSRSFESRRLALEHEDADQRLFST